MVWESVIAFMRGPSPGRPDAGTDTRVAAHRSHARRNPGAPADGGGATGRLSGDYNPLPLVRRLCPPPRLWAFL